MSVLFWAGGVQAQPADGYTLARPHFQDSLEQTSSSGHIKLMWEADRSAPVQGVAYQLQKSRIKDFNDARVIYQGEDLGTFLSGLADGAYYFRLRHVRDTDGTVLSAWSDPLVLTVTHHSLSLALWLFVLGFVVFVTTVAVLVKGVRDVKG